MMSEAPRRVHRSDLVRIRWPMEPAVSSDGSQVAYIVSGPDEAADRVRYRLVVFDRSSGQTSPVADAVDIRSPAWSPAGDHLACLRGAGVATIEEGAAVRELFAPQGVARRFAWSPDGSRLAIVVAAEMPPPDDSVRRIGSLDDLRGSTEDEIWLAEFPSGDAVRQPVSGVTAIDHVAWSPDAGSLAFSGRRLDAEMPVTQLGVFVLDIAIPKLREIVPERGAIKGLAWSPLGDRLAFVGHEAGSSHAANLELFVVRVDGEGGAESLSSGLDRSVGQVVRGDDERGTGPSDLVWSDRGILVACAFGGSSGLLRFHPGGGHEEIVGGSRAVLGFAESAAGEVVFTWSDAATPGEITMCAPDGSEERQLSDVNRDWRVGVGLSGTEAVAATASDGIEVEGWLTVPGDEFAAPFPLVLQVHGGPHYPVGNRFSFDAQRLAACGIALLRANPRGAQGYGSRFASAVVGDWGGRDFADLEALLDEVGARPDIDADRVAVVGESYGGFMVNWALGHSRRFAAGIAENGIAYVAGVATHPVGGDFWEAELGGPAWDSAETLSAISPYFSASAITAPLLLIHAEEDSTVPIEQSEAMYVALRRLGRDVRLVRIPGEQHRVNVLGAPSRRLERLRVFDEFLQEHLLPETTENGVTP